MIFFLLLKTFLKPSNHPNNEGISRKKRQTATKRQTKNILAKKKPLEQDRTENKNFYGEYWDSVASKLEMR